MQPVGNAIVDFKMPLTKCGMSPVVHNSNNVLTVVSK